MSKTTFKNLRNKILKIDKKMEIIKKRRKHLTTELQKRCAHVVVLESPENAIVPTRRCLICAFEEHGIVIGDEYPKNKTIWGNWPRNYYFDELDRNPYVSRNLEEWHKTRVIQTFALQPLSSLKKMKIKNIPLDLEKKGGRVMSNAFPFGW